MRTGHLLYIDITNECSIGCRFCMYKEGRGSSENLVLTGRSQKGISTLINDPNIDTIIISGEGEPFNNKETIHAILSLSDGGRRFQILTCGAWEDKVNRLHTLGTMASSHEDTYLLRLSIDRFHARNIDHRHYLELLSLLLRSDSNVSLGVRSIVEDKRLVRSMVGEMLTKLGIGYQISSPGILDDDIMTEYGRIPITYKNIVNPRAAGIQSPFPMVAYIEALQSKYRRTFTLGNIRSLGPIVGLDVTIKPNGNIFFYGAEFRPFGHVCDKGLSFTSLEKHIVSHPWLNTLYTRPFLNIIDDLSREDSARDLIQAVNNPYWIVPNLYLSHVQLLQKVLGGKYH